MVFILLRPVHKTYLADSWVPRTQALINAGRKREPGTHRLCMCPFFQEFRGNSIISVDGDAMKSTIAMADIQYVLAPLNRV